MAPSRVVPFCTGLDRTRRAGEARARRGAHVGTGGPAPLGPPSETVSPGPLPAARGCKAPPLHAATGGARGERLSSGRGAWRRRRWRAGLLSPVLGWHRGFKWPQASGELPAGPARTCPAPSCAAWPRHPGGLVPAVRAGAAARSLSLRTRVSI